MVETCLFNRDVDLAMKICRSEIELDRLFEEKFALIMERLRSEGNVEELVSSLFIIRYFERMGDCLLNIGEAVISAALGQKLKIDQYVALEGTLAEQAARETRVLDAERGLYFESIGETKSGSRVGRVRQRDRTEAPRWVLFKEGQAKKLLEEKRCIEEWERRVPGLPPKILGMKEEADNASLLIEFLDGLTFQKIVVERSLENTMSAMDDIQRVLEHIWNTTKMDKPVHAGFMQQLQSRIDDVFLLHPDLNAPDRTIGAVRVPSFHELIARVAEIEQELPAPFSVFIHGDFNSDNIIYNFSTGRVHFIDLHRSRDMDYVQDVSVFILSNFRMPIFDGQVRKRTNQVAVSIYQFSRSYALGHGDTSFDARLVLGLVRSFITSTRFVLNDEFAKLMFLRACYLMEKLTEHRPRPWEEFELPIDAIVY
jgi:hypothetical protein